MRCLGSRRSRRASPNRLVPNTTALMATPGKTTSQGAVRTYSAAEYVRTAPWLVIFPGVAISAVVFGTNLFGDALRDLLDPRQRT